MENSIRIPVQAIGRYIGGNFDKNQDLMLKKSHCLCFPLCQSQFGWGGISWPEPLSVFSRAGGQRACEGRCHSCQGVFLARGWSVGTEDLDLACTMPILAMERAITMAAENGLGSVAMNNTNHWMRAGNYGWQAVESGCIGICFTNTIPNMPAWGG